MRVDRGRRVGTCELTSCTHLTRTAQGVGRASLQIVNLILPKGARGKVVGLTSAAGSKWNDQIGKVLSFDRDTGRYQIEMTPEEQLRIKPDNLQF